MHVRACVCVCVRVCVCVCVCVLASERGRTDSFRVADGSDARFSIVLFWFETIKPDIESYYAFSFFFLRASFPPYEYIHSSSCASEMLACTSATRYH